MEIISKVLLEAIDVNLSYVVLMDIVVGFLYLFNIILGTIIGTSTSHFDIKKFFFGVLKAICVLLIILGVCYILNVFTLTLNQLSSVNIDTDLIGTLEVISILIVNIVDISKEIIDKLKSFRELRYESYDKVSFSDTNIVEPIEFKG